MKTHETGKTTWHFSERPWRVSSIALEDTLAQALEILALMGVRVPASGRHRKAQRLLGKSNRAPTGIGGLTPGEQRKLADVHRTAFETCLIVVAAYRLRRAGKSNSPFTRHKLQEIMKGNDAYGPGRSAARDIQFELYVAAQLVLGGLDVTGGEPDLRFLYGYERVGVAVKRLDSLKPAQLRRNIKDAVEQIDSSKRRGWVALNVDNRFLGVGIFGNRRTILSRFTAAFEWIAPIAAECAGGTNVLGIMAYAHVSSWRPANSKRKVPELLVRVPFRWVCWEREEEPAGNLLFKNIHDGWRDRVDDAIQLIMSGKVSTVV